MAITQAMCTSFKKELMTATHNFTAASNVFKLALYTSSASLTFDGFTNLKFDQVSSNYNFYGKVRNLQVFTEALSDAELQQLTT